MRSDLAHIGGAPSGFGVFGTGWAVALGAVAIAALVVHHHRVAGFDRSLLARRARRTVAIAALASLAGFAFGPPGLDIGASGAQSADAQLPDLISDPPRASFVNRIMTPDGTSRLVVTFDGYVHNIGQGALDVVGNPQVPDGMRQRVLTNGQWQDVGTPTVRYETDDGHNHFHLIEAIEYFLWDDELGAQTVIGSKIGFCLVDSEQMEPGTEQAYSEEMDNFCQENNPGATDLRMGISPGWRDVYDATTTLQWVDVSTVTPGYYWLGALTDPNDEVAESNEANNDTVLSQSTIAVPGFAPRPTRVQVDAPVATVELAADVFGTVAQPIFVVEQGPSSGRLDVPVGAALSSPTVRYFPDPGFQGSDEIVFSVRDSASPFPLDAPVETVTFQVTADATGSGAQPADGGAFVTLAPPSTFFESELAQAFSVDIDASADAERARVFASGLPSGLVVDSATGTLSGVPTESGIFDVTLYAAGPGPANIVEQAVSWIVNPADPAVGLSAGLDRSSARGGLTRISVGTPQLGSTYEADGLPPGLAMETTSPLISGVPTEAGRYDVTVRRIDQGQVVEEITFDWEIRSSAAVEFAL